MTDYLYHYTSIENLTLILKNRTIKFNNLQNVDDPEEAETGDIETAGRHCLVSCWTDKEENVILMWSMYTPDMKGVRIKMRKYPFKQYVYGKNELHFKEETKSYINYKDEYAKIVSIVPSFPLLEKIEYTRDESLIKPKILTRTEREISLSFYHIGRCKRSCWDFQQEYRYIIRTAPWSIKELDEAVTPEEHELIFNRIKDKNNTQFCNEIYLELAEDTLDDMEILLAPKTSEAEWVIVQALLDKYCPNTHIQLDKSRIRVR